LIKIRIMYWKEIPVQIEFSDPSTKKSIKLDERFQFAVDSISMLDGSYGSDDYLDGWKWVNKEDIKEELTEEFIDGYTNKYKYPQDLIKKITSLLELNKRDEAPGSIDSWLVGK
tara:strand:- start:3104 stop:3445 length:342 start_codon:yes stop_codon:yes gene_type:complete